MSFLIVSKCQNQQEFMEIVNEIEKTLSTSRVERALVQKISEFFENNMDYIANDKAVAIQLDSIVRTVKTNFYLDPLIVKLQNYVRQLLPAKSKEEIESSCSVLKENAKNYLQSLANWINLMEIPLSSLNLSEQELYDLIPKLSYVDLRNLDFTKYDLTKFRLNQNFSLKLMTANKETLFTLGKLCAWHNPYVTTTNIQNLGIKDKTHLYEIAKICAQKDAEITAKDIKNFGIEDKAHLYEIAKICAVHHEYGIAEIIKNFDLENKMHLFEIAKLCARKNSRVTENHIRNFGIEDKTHLFEIAKICALYQGGKTAAFIKSFGIEDKTHLYELVKLCAQQDGAETAAAIKDFGIEDKEMLYEIATLCARQNGRGTAFYIKNFKIEDKMQLFEIAKLCAQNDGLATSEYIENFGINDNAHLYELAKLSARQSGGGTASNIQNYRFKDKTQLYEIAKLCAQESGCGTATNILKFRINDQTQLFEIAKLCVQQDGYGTATHFENFRIIDKAHLYEIAKLSAEKSGGETAYHIKIFKIEDKAQLFEIAKLCAQQDGDETAVYIKNFGIEDQKQLFEIAELCAQQNGEGTAKNIKNFGIDDPQKRWELFLKCLITDNNALGSIQHFCPLSNELVVQHTLLADLCFVMLDGNKENKTVRDRFFIDLKRLINKIPCSTENKQKLVRFTEEISEKPIHIQNEAAAWILKALFFSKQMLPENLDWMLGSKLWDELAMLREPRLRSLLTPALFELSKCKKRDIPKGTHGLPLIAIPFFQLQQLGVNPEKLKEITLKLKTLQNKPDTLLKNRVTIQTILHTIHLLASTYTLSSEEKIEAVDKIFYNRKKLIEDDIVIVLKNITAAKGLLQLKNKEWTRSSKDPVTEFRASFERLITIKDVEGDVSEQYEKIFAKSRNPYGLITYAAGLKTLSDPEAMNCLGRYVSTVFNGTFKDTRYDTRNNPHLKTISESNPDLLELWKLDFEKPLEEISLNKEKKEDFDPKKWIENKLVSGESHLGETKIPFIEEYIKAKTIEEKELVSKKLTEELQKEPSKILILQQACIAFAESQPDNFIPLLKKMQENVDPKAEFAKDIAGLLKSKQTFFNLKVVITDDPVDLLLCGSDVSGSCQRLDGTPRLNKGLLGYLMDGKNRLLAIKDGSGKIVARSILRLLWDGERPVIYRERFYPDNCDSTYKNAMNQVAKDLAKTLKVPLTCEIGLPYGKPLHALGGPAPYEYCDANGGVQKKSQYTVLDAYTIQEGGL